MEEEKIMTKEEVKDGKNGQGRRKRWKKGTEKPEQLEGGKQSACSLKYDTTVRLVKKKKKTQFIGLLLLMGDNILC